MTTSMLYPVFFMIIGALVFAFSDKARSLGLVLFGAGALVLCMMFAKHVIHF